MKLFNERIQSMTLPQLIIVGLTLTMLGPVFAIADWELREDNDDIRVFTIAIPDSTSP